MAKSSSEYWRERFMIMEEAAHKKVEDYAQALQAEYDRASRSIQADIERWYARFAGNNNITMGEARKWLKEGELEEFRWTVEEYIKYGEDNAQCH